MNKKTISMIAMVATIIYTIMHSADLIGWLGNGYSYPTIETISLFLLRITALVFIALFFRSNYMQQDNRRISLIVAIFIFIVVLFSFTSELISIFTHSLGGNYIWRMLYKIFMIAMGIFFIFNYLEKSKKQISLVIAIIIGLLLPIHLYHLFNGWIFSSTLSGLSHLFYLISLILFFVTVFKSETEPDSEESKIIAEKPVPAPIKKSVRTVSNDKKGNLTIGEWMLMMFLVSIPIVGLVMLLVWAFESNPHPIKSNWAKANLIWGLIMMLFSFFIILLVVLVTVM